jgi:hypothetical protein
VPCRPPGDATVPPELSALNYIFFYAEPWLPGSGSRTGLAQLVSALDTDLDWLREHTRLLQRASEWDSAGSTRRVSASSPPPSITPLAYGTRARASRSGSHYNTMHPSRARFFDPQGERVLTTTMNTDRQGPISRVWRILPSGQTLVDEVRAVLGLRAPEPLRLPDNVNRQESYAALMALGAQTLFARTQSLFQPH